MRVRNAPDQRTQKMWDKAADAMAEAVDLMRAASALRTEQYRDANGLWPGAHFSYQKDGKLEYGIVLDVVNDSLYDYADPRMRVVVSFKESDKTFMMETAKTFWVDADTIWLIEKPMFRHTYPNE